MKIREFTPYERNPFLNDMEDDMQPRNKIVFGKSTDDRLLVTTDGGEIDGKVFFGRIKKVDSSQFRKVYVDNLKAFFGLSQNEYRVLFYILKTIKPNIDTFYFSMSDCMDFTEYKTHVPITKALAKLLDLRFIARHKEKGWYFINPTIFFNGDRITFLTQYVKSEETKEIGDSEGV